MYEQLSPGEGPPALGTLLALVRLVETLCTRPPPHFPREKSLGRGSPGQREPEDPREKPGAVGTRVAIDDPATRSPALA